MVGEKKKKDRKRLRVRIGADLGKKSSLIF